jgi:cytochrome c
VKRIILSFICVSFLFFNCSEKKKKKPSYKVAQSSVEKGKTLFNSNACNTCHHEQVKLIGPSIKDIAVKYKIEKGNIVSFLQGQSKAIVDLNPGQIAMMKANLSITKSMKIKKLKAISEYIMSIE